jgi:glycosyltransferase involved in cell wall biosynthesis
MRVLHLSSGNLFGGIETLLIALARNDEATTRIDQHFGLSFEGRLSAALREVGAPVHLLGGVRLSRPASVWRARRTLRAVLASERIDLAVCHSSWPLVAFGPATRAAGLPLGYWLHGTVEADHWLERLARRTPPDFAVCNSHFTSAKLPALFPGVPYEVLYYPVEPHRLLPREEAISRALRQELDTPEDAVIIVQVSRMEEWKGHLLHLEALGHLRELPGWFCWQVGGAQRPSEVAYQRTLERRAEELGIADRVRFLGQRSDVPRILAAADVFCQPNTGPEPFGIVFVEALSAGLPAVTTAMGGAQEIVDETCGVLVPPGDARALAAALQRLVVEPDLRSRLGSAGPERARMLCDPSVQTRRLGSLLDRAARQAVVG